MFNLFTIHLTTSSYMLILFPIIGLTSCISNLKHLSIISTIANILQLTGLSLIFADLFQLHQMTTTTALVSNITSLEELLSANSLSQTDSSGTIVNSVSNDLVAGLPLFFATAVYAFEGIGVVLPLVKEMERPELFPGFNGVLNTSMMLVGLLYMAMGYFGYLKYGQFINGSITINLPKTTLNEFVRLMFAMAIGLSYGLQFYVPWTIMWPYIDERLFYAYRPRAARDKLDLMSKIREINLTESMAKMNKQQQQQRHNNDNDSNNNDDNNNNNKSRQQQQQLAPTTANDQGNDLLTSYWRKRHNMDNFQNSFGATMATSYTMSTNYTTMAQQQQQQQQQLVTNNNQQVTTTSSSAPLADYFGTRYKSFDLRTTDGEPQMPAKDMANVGIGSPVSIVSPGGVGSGHKVARNRFEDVIGNDSTSSGRSMPDVKWRPPPRSMRGKRKLVRYTVILLFVALTCKYPHLDLRPYWPLFRNDGALLRHYFAVIPHYLAMMRHSFAMMRHSFAIMPQSFAIMPHYLAISSFSVDHCTI